VSRISPTYSTRACGGFLLDDMDYRGLLDSLHGRSSVFGWDRRISRRSGISPTPPRTRNTFAIHSFMTVAFDQNDKPTSASLVVNGKRPKRPVTGELAWAARVARHVGPSLEKRISASITPRTPIEGELSGIYRDPSTTACCQPLLSWNPADSCPPRGIFS